MKNSYAGKKKACNKPTKSFPNKGKRKLAKYDKGSYYNQGKQINEHEYGKGQCCNEHYDDDLNLITTDESSCSDEWEDESLNDSVPHEIFFGKEKNYFCIFRTIINFF